MNAQKTDALSAYFLAETSDVLETHTLSIIVDNEPGVLARVIGLYSGRGYNIDSLSVSETEHEKHVSRITIVTTGTPQIIEQIRHQLDRLVPVHIVRDLTVAARNSNQEKPLERELALIKVRGEGEKRLEALRLSEAFRATVIDATIDHFVFEITGRTNKIDQFIEILTPLGLVEVSRTGVAALSRGSQGLKDLQDEI
ncbi:putative acetolactate synthase small subunit [Pseudovibrio sp. W64]|jgi:acetolactate synthase-1/3 small subunit|uniref:Acetolactate synthase small subunit n=1 Tax=Pseudovibrio ascidiaceicola TaxID=285279 RepID=A0A1I3XL98_9HYPH|nr:MULTISPECIES: acetolactate synthase small subunit [Pseudovibrio]KZK80367.1 putative acetolactate synthase small subunit [Pseudovibrio sp. Ad13]KZK83728.1 putative acetolactate synthase small subunit [Pseudovibrio sp. W64]KZK94809.1 putative acetolactate synthase small subunit [Pseudovibrio sp. W74]KZK98993.1 putative acetolactate synthase small subunit [Pseudovibrio sp. Ad26]KZL04632.1 putative acetolactate synthase small subunit [Pseudovibrio sp. Ad14]